MTAQLPPAEPGLLAQVALQTHTSVVVTDVQGFTVWVNPAFERVSGYGLADMLGRKPGDVLQSPDTDPAAVARISRALRQREPVAGVELLNVSRQGQPYWVRLDISPIRDSRGEVSHFLSVQSDVTEQHADALRRQTEAHAALRDLERRDVLTRLRREFRMPLNSLLGFAQLLRVEAEQGGLQSMAQRIEHMEAAGLQLLDMLDEMLATASAGGDRATLQPVHIWESLERHLPREVAVVDPGPEARQATVWADPALLRRVVGLAGTMGLVPGQAGVGPRLELLSDAGRRRRGLRFTYPNRARPVAQAQRMRLDLIRQVVLDMGGTLEVDDGPAGYAITLHLRAVTESREGAPDREPGGETATQRARRPAPASPWSMRSDVRGRVLYVEDDHGNVEIVRHALRSRPGVELQVAASVDEAERLLGEGEPPGLMLVDLMLPGRGGLALLELRTRQEALARVPCVVLTSLDDLAQEDAARALGASDYLVKPLRLDRLLRLVDGHLGRGPA